MLRALNRMEPRQLQVLLRRVVERRTREQFALLYGIDTEQADLLVWRAIRSFEAALASAPEPPVLSFDQETAEARALANEPELPPYIRGLAEHSDDIEAGIERAEREAEASPSRSRENWLRRLAIALVLVIAAYLYWRDTYAPKERRPPEARPARLKG